MADNKLIDQNPLLEDRILRDGFYRAPAARPEPDESVPRSAKGPRPKKEKPTHYKVVCISLYTQDIENLEATVAELKKRGYTKANKSQLIRYALRQLDIDKLPPPQQ